ncbi:hypothetical protein [Alienimonas chondri]|uniref:DUF4282 domain-containing protein n=1 Tax=Alienimonas chondri TaxID=2681879 RepID=A0ABX1VDX4_9PLAN|nr:hypothetical protein [Alienimonas chondri]NNJ25493.1 hypothetical protein [Alienimonas chondri]
MKPFHSPDESPGGLDDDAMSVDDGTTAAEDGTTAAEDESVADDPMAPDYPVEKLTLEEIDFEAQYWFRKSFPAVCTAVWIVLALASQIVFEFSSNVRILMLLGGTFLVMVLSIMLSMVLEIVFHTSIDFFLRVSLLWTRVFKSESFISHARLRAIRRRRKDLLAADRGGSHRHGK